MYKASKPGLTAGDDQTKFTHDGNMVTVFEYYNTVKKVAIKKSEPLLLVLLNAKTDRKMYLPLS
jgi:hypothetical protein